MGGYVNSSKCSICDGNQLHQQTGDLVKKLNGLNVTT